MRIQGLLLSMLAIALTGAGAPDTSSPDVRQSVEKILHDQQDAWNRRDLQSFMASYWNSPDLTFFSGAQKISGW